MNVSETARKDEKEKTRILQHLAVADFTQHGKTHMTRRKHAQCSTLEITSVGQQAKLPATDRARNGIEQSIEMSFAAAHFDSPADCGSDWVDWFHLESLLLTADAAGGRGGILSFT